MNKSAFLEFSFLSGLAVFGFTLMIILVGTVLFSLSVPLNQVFVSLSDGIEPTHFEMGIAVSIFILFYFVASRITILAYMIVVFFSLWYLVITASWVVWLAPAMIGTIVMCPIIIYYIKLIAGQLEEH